MKSTKELAWELGLLRKRSSSTSAVQRLLKTNQLFTHLIVIDFESTCWKDQKFKSQEIIEFPAVLLDTKSGDILEVFHHYVQPQEDPILSAFCKQLTGITQDQVDEGIPLNLCLRRFNQWLKKLMTKYKIIFYNSDNPTANRCTFVTWSDWDLSVCLLYECRRKQLRKPAELNSWIDLRAVYRKFYSRKPQGLNGALKDVGIVFEGREHSGVCDAKNTAKLAYRMIQDGCVMMITRSLNTTQSMPPPSAPPPPRHAVAAVSTPVVPAPVLSAPAVSAPVTVVSAPAVHPVIAAFASSCVKSSVVLRTDNTEHQSHPSTPSSIAAPVITSNTDIPCGKRMRPPNTPTTRHMLSSSKVSGLLHRLVNSPSKSPVGKKQRISSTPIKNVEMVSPKANTELGKVGKKRALFHTPTKVMKESGSPKLNSDLDELDELMLTLSPHFGRQTSLLCSSPSHSPVRKLRRSANTVPKPGIPKSITLGSSNNPTKLGITKSMPFRSSNSPTKPGISKPIAFTHTDDLDDIDELMLTLSTPPHAKKETEQTEKSNIYAEYNSKGLRTTCEKPTMKTTSDGDELDDLMLSLSASPHFTQIKQTNKDSTTVSAKTSCLRKGTVSSKMMERFRSSRRSISQCIQLISRKFSTIKGSDNQKTSVVAEAKSIDDSAIQAKDTAVVRLPEIGSIPSQTLNSRMSTVTNADKTTLLDRTAEKSSSPEMDELTHASTSLETPGNLPTSVNIAAASVRQDNKPSTEVTLIQYQRTEETSTIKTDSTSSNIAKPLRTPENLSRTVQCEESKVNCPDHDVTSFKTPVNLPTTDQCSKFKICCDSEERTPSIKKPDFVHSEERTPSIKKPDFVHSEERTPSIKKPDFVHSEERTPSIKKPDFVHSEERTSSIKKPDFVHSEERTSLIKKPDFVHRSATVRNNAMKDITNQSDQSNQCVQQRTIDTCFKVQKSLSNCGSNFQTKLTNQQSCFKTPSNIPHENQRPGNPPQSTLQTTGPLAINRRLSLGCNPSGMRRTPPLCICGRRSNRRMVQTMGPNIGRFFYACPLGRKDMHTKKSGCGFFKWEGSVGTMSKVQNNNETKTSMTSFSTSASTSMKTTPQNENSSASSMLMLKATPHTLNNMSYFKPCDSLATPLAPLQQPNFNTPMSERLDGILNGGVQKGLGVSSGRANTVLKPPMF